MKLETLDDILTMDFDKLKSAEKTRILTRVKQLVKAQNKSDATEDNEAEDFPYEGVSVVGTKFVSLKFDLESKKARVVDVQVDNRPANGKNYMVGAQAVRRIQHLVKKQKEVDNG